MSDLLIALPHLETSLAQLVGSALPIASVVEVGLFFVGLLLVGLAFAVLDRLRHMDEQLGGILVRVRSIGTGSEARAPAVDTDGPSAESPSTSKTVVPPPLPASPTVGSPAPRPPTPGFPPRPTEPVSEAAKEPGPPENPRPTESRPESIPPDGPRLTMKTRRSPSPSGRDAPPAILARRAESPKPPARSAPVIPRPNGRALTIIVGTIALFLAGVYLVKLFVDQGLFPPAWRMISAAAFSAVLVGVAEWFRTRFLPIGRGLAVAGVLVALATVWATENLYGFIGAPTALLLCGGVVAGALWLGRRFGSETTWVGLVGGFIAPALVGFDHLSTLHLFGGLALLQIGLAIEGCTRRSEPLRWVATAGAFAWPLVWLAHPGTDPTTSVIAPAYLIATTAFGIPWVGRQRGDDPATAIVAWSTGTIIAVLHAFRLIDIESSALDATIGWGAFAAVAAVTTAIRRGTAPVSIVHVLFSLGTIALAAVHEGGGWFAGTIAGTIGLFALLPLGLAIARSRDRGFWIALASAVIPATLLLGFALDFTEIPDATWGFLLAGGAAILGGAAVALAPRLRTALDDPGITTLATSAVVTACAAALVGLGPVDASVAMVLVAGAVALVARRAPFAGWSWLTLLPLGFGAGRMLALPEVIHAPIPAHPVLHWLPWGFGVPALVAGALALRGPEPSRGWMRPTLGATAIILTLAMVHWWVHHVFHPESPTLLAEGPSGEGEGLAYSITWIVTSQSFFAAAIFGRSPDLNSTARSSTARSGAARGSKVFGWLGATTMVLAVGKVFLWDTRELDDLYRVASYFGLGVSLFGLAWAMHKWMPRESDDAPKPPSDELPGDDLAPREHGREGA